MLGVGQEGHVKLDVSELLPCKIVVVSDSTQTSRYRDGASMLHTSWLPANLWAKGITHQR